MTPTCCFLSQIRPTISCRSRLLCPSMHSHFKKLKKPDQLIEEQQADERKKEMEMAEEEKEGGGQRHTQGAERRLNSTRKPGRPKKQKVDAQNVTISVSSAGRENVNNITISVQSSSPASSSAIASGSCIFLLLPPPQPLPPLHPSHCLLLPLLHHHRYQTSSLTASSAWGPLVPKGNVKGPSYKRGGYIDWVADYHLFEQIILAVDATRGMPGFASAISDCSNTLPALNLPSLIVDKRLPVLKPSIVEWAFDSWKELNKPGLDKIFDADRQDEAASSLLLAGIRLDEHDVEDRGESAADECEEEDEAEECDDAKNDDGVHEDEEEVRIDEIIAAAINEERPKGTRRSARTQQSAQMISDHRIATSL